MLKNTKLSRIIILSIILILLIGINCCHAVDLNLTDMDDLTNTNITNDANNTSVDNETSNTTANDEDTYNNTNSSNTSYNTSNSTSNTPAPSTTVSNLNSLPESNLGLSTILNILLIVIGVLLILLAIAILIRLKK